MIARLRGLVDSIGPDFVVIDVAGVGYLVSASSRTLARLGAPGEEAVIHTEMLVSDDSIRLVGFASAAERDWFRLLISVQGVGARVALSILSALSTDEAGQAVSAGDSAMISRAQGVGPKLAQRIVNELKDKVGAIASVGAAGAGAPVMGLARDAASALVNLGFRPAEAAAAVARAQGELGDDASLDALVRAALRKAS